MPSLTYQSFFEPLVQAPITVEQLPTAFADAVGTTYAKSRGEEHRKRYGLYLTPPAVARFMAGTVNPRLSSEVRVLDPAAGAGMLTCAVLERLIGHPDRPETIEVTAYELDADLCGPLRVVLDRAISWAAAHGVSVTADIRQQDFILAQADALGTDSPDRFDVAIANPPYFKIGKGDPRALAAHAVVHGQPNIYGLFMAVAAATLRPGGEMVFITPRSFASGLYFKRFRERFFDMMRPLRAHVFGSRRDTFRRDSVLQENVILHAVRDDHWLARRETFTVTMSSSAGSADLSCCLEWSADLRDVIRSKAAGTVLRLPASREDEAVLALIDRWTGSLRGYGMDISTGPVVPFRATRWLVEQHGDSTVPLLWMNHVRPMSVCWPNGTRKAQHFTSRPESRRLLLPNRNYVLLRRFSAKEERRRLTAAPLLTGALTTPLIGLENHLNYIHRPGGSLSPDETWGLAALYNSLLFDTYFRCVNGNTQVGATELRAMPLPPLHHIVNLGYRVQRERDPVAVVDDFVMDMVRSISSVEDDAIA